MDAECEAGCGSSRFRIGDDGFSYCSEGHRQSQRGTQIVEDTEGVPQFGKKARREKEIEEHINENALVGRRAFEHYLLCFQLVLWKQVHWLINVKSLPSELETVVRDVWSLRLQSLQSRVSYDSESEAEQSSQLYSSQSEAERTDDTAIRHQSKKSRNEAVPRLVDAMSMCYIGILLLRLPVTVSDIHEWAAAGEMIYYRAVKVLPESMRAQLPYNYVRIVDPQNTLRPGTLQQAILDNILAYDRSFGMIMPSINHHLVLYRWIRQLALPLEVYACTLHLAKTLDITFTYDTKIQRPTRYTVLRLAEPRLMGLLVVATKLLFPLDDKKRYPRESTELSAMSMDWSVWKEARSGYNKAVKESTRLGYQDAMQIKSEDVFDMSDAKLDEYMDWYSSVFAEDRIRERGRLGKEAEFRRALLRLFPVEQTTNSQTDAMDIDDEASRVDLKEERLRKVQSTLRPVRVKTEQALNQPRIYRPGDRYKRYRKAEELDDYAMVFYEEAAKLVALPLNALVRCVFYTEKNWERWEDNEAKR